MIDEKKLDEMKVQAEVEAGKIRELWLKQFKGKRVKQNGSNQGTGNGQQEAAANSEAQHNPGAGSENPSQYAAGPGG